MKPIEQRLWAKVAMAGKDECWLWQAHRNKCGYGTIQVGGRSRLAHRIVYEITHGPFLLPLKVLHSCDNPACCNPAHLWLGTQADNVADMNAKGRNGNVGRRMSAEAIAKREITYSRNRSRFGRKCTEETKAKMRATWLRNDSHKKRWETRRKKNRDG